MGKLLHSLVAFGVLLAACSGSNFTGAPSTTVPDRGDDAAAGGALDAALPDAADADAAPAMATVSDAGVDAETGPDADDGPHGDLHISCGARTCVLPSACCIFGSGKVCQAGGACPTMSVPPTVLACDKSANCAVHQVCCVGADSGGIVRSACATSCPSGAKQMCTPSVSAAQCRSGSCGGDDNVRLGLDISYGTCN